MEEVQRPELHLGQVAELGPPFIIRAVEVEGVEASWSGHAVAELAVVAHQAVCEGEENAGGSTDTDESTRQRVRYRLAQLQEPWLVNDGARALKVSTVAFGSSFTMSLAQHSVLSTNGAGGLRRRWMSAASYRGWTRQNFGVVQSHTETSVECVSCPEVVSLYSDRPCAPYILVHCETSLLTI